MSQRFVYFNGKFIPEIEARISIFDCDLMHGDMVFEMTRTYNQKPYRRLLAAWSEEVGVDIAGQARDYAELAGSWTP